MMHLNQETKTRGIKSSFVLLLNILSCVYEFFWFGYILQRTICIAEIANVLQSKVDHYDLSKSITSFGIDVRL